MYVRPDELEPGDEFIEDTYPEVWTVTKKVTWEGHSGVEATVTRDFDGKDPSPRLGETAVWAGEGMCLIRIN